MIEEKVKKIEEKLIETRRMLHKIPEIAFEEVKTSQYIRDRLTELNIPFTVMAKTGVVALIEGEKHGKTLLIRGDIDALPIEEDLDLEFKSQNKGYMHACGHDVHTTCLLGVAEILNEMKNELAGNVKLVFQPAEEGVGGAEPMINEGVMKNPHVDGAIALHVEPLEEVGKILIKDGSILASPDDFFITIHGKGGHGAMPQNCVDPILVGSMIVSAYQTIVSRHFDPLVPTVVSICSFNAGTCTNVIPETAYLQGTARSLTKETREEMKRILEKIAKDTADSMGATCDFVFNPLYPPTVNDKGMNILLEKSASKISDISEVVRLENPTMLGDDFAYFAELVPATYFRLGVGNSDKSKNYPLHHPKFYANEEAIAIGTSILTQFVVDYLNS